MINPYRTNDDPNVVFLQRLYDIVSFYNVHNQINSESTVHNLMEPFYCEEFNSQIDSFKENVKLVDLFTMKQQSTIEYIFNILFYSMQNSIDCNVNYITNDKLINLKVTELTLDDCLEIAKSELLFKEPNQIFTYKIDSFNVDGLKPIDFCESEKYCFYIFEDIEDKIHIYGSKKNSELYIKPELIFKSDVSGISYVKVLEKNNNLCIILDNICWVKCSNEITCDYLFNTTSPFNCVGLNTFVLFAEVIRNAIVMVDITQTLVILNMVTLEIIYQKDFNCNIGNTSSDIATSKFIIGAACDDNLFILMKHQSHFSIYSLNIYGNITKVYICPLLSHNIIDFFENIKHIHVKNGAIYIINILNEVYKATNIVDLGTSDDVSEYGGNLNKYHDLDGKTGFTKYHAFNIKNDVVTVLSTNFTKHVGISYTDKSPILLYEDISKYDFLKINNVKTMVNINVVTPEFDIKSYDHTLISSFKFEDRYVHIAIIDEMIVTSDQQYRHNFIATSTTKFSDPTDFYELDIQLPSYAREIIGCGGSLIFLKDVFGNVCIVDVGYNLF